MSKWEYQTVRVNYNPDGEYYVEDSGINLDEFLEDADQQGWELISVAPVMAGWGGQRLEIQFYTAWLKRLRSHSD